MTDSWQLLMDEICFRFNDARAKAERTEALAPNSYGAGFDRGYSDALGELLEYMADQKERVAKAIQLRADESGYMLQRTVVRQLAAAAIEAMQELPQRPDQKDASNAR